MLASFIAGGAAAIVMVFKVGGNKIVSVFSPKRRRAMAEARAAAADPEEAS
jgi:hypothetical protein